MASLGKIIKSVGTGVIDTGTAPHIVVKALAGTGKTTTLIEGLRPLRNLKPRVTPTEQQQAIWDALAMEPAQSVCFTAFGKDIAKELQTRMPPRCYASTTHSLGYAAIRQAFSIGGDRAVNVNRVTRIIEEITGITKRDKTPRWYEVAHHTSRLTALVKQNLIPLDDEDEHDLAAVYRVLDDLCFNYEVPVRDEWKDEIYQLVIKVVNRCKDVAKDKCVDWNDQIWIPVIMGLKLYKYDLMVVDEAQDLNQCQQALVRRMARRLVICGDPRQAIFAFAGADSQSMPRLEGELSKTKRGCLSFPLTMTRRCGKRIVQEARKFVPEFEAYEENPEASIRYAVFPKGERVGNPNDYISEVAPGDMVLCRCNAPLIRECYRLLRRGVRARVLGRNVADGLVTFIRRTNAGSIPHLRQCLAEWYSSEYTKEMAKSDPNYNHLANLLDKVQCIEVFIGNQEIESVWQLLNAIEAMFGEHLGDEDYVRLSTIHKAKGLEARRVWFLMPRGAQCPHPAANTDWQKEQELNLCYVAITRAIEELIFVS